MQQPSDNADPHSPGLWFRNRQTGELYQLRLSPWLGAALRAAASGSSHPQQAVGAALMAAASGNPAGEAIIAAAIGSSEPGQSVGAALMGAASGGSEPGQPGSGAYSSAHGAGAYAPAARRLPLALSGSGPYVPALSLVAT